MNEPSAHLTWKELRCHDGTDYPFIWRTNRAIQIAEIFEHIRTMCGGHPIRVTSAYRTPEWNKKVGGAECSQHIAGRALDLVPPIGYNIDTFYDLIKKISRNTDLKGIGKYKNFIHIDVRPVPKLVLWFGPGVNNAIT